MAANLRILTAGVALVAAVGLVRLEVPPVPTWFYVFAWYPTLVILDALVERLGGESLLSRPGALAAMLWWSAVIWFGFEALNFRLRNWYYIFAPDHGAERWIGITVSFATVVPAILLPERLLQRLGAWRELRGRPLAVERRHLSVSLALGLALLAAIMAAPRVLYPLTWGAVWLVAEPLLYRSDPDRSLFGDLARGQWGRIARLMAGGLVAGLLWETYNTGDRGKWIYTVPLLEDLKLFEMPLPGFLGFPFFALEVWSLYHLLARHTRVGPLATSAIFAVLVLAGMDRWTVSSVTPRVAELPGLSTDARGRLVAAGVDDVFRLSATPPEEIAQAAGVSAEDARRVRESARLTTLRGIGTKHAAALVAAGIPSVEALAAADPDAVWRAVGGGGGPRPTPAEVRVWVRAARGATGR